MNADIVQVKVFEVSELPSVKSHQQRDGFRGAKPGGTVPLFIIGRSRKLMFGEFFFKSIAEIIGSDENFCNFVAERWGSFYVVFCCLSNTYTTKTIPFSLFFIP